MRSQSSLVAVNIVTWAGASIACGVAVLVAAYVALGGFRLDQIGMARVSFAVIAGLVGGLVVAPLCAALVAAGIARRAGRPAVFGRRLAWALATAAVSGSAFALASPSELGLVALFLGLLLVPVVVLLPGISTARR